MGRSHNQELRDRKAKALRGELDGSPPTARQLEVLRYIASCRLPPSQREVRAHLGLTSTNAVATHYAALAHKGLIEWLPVKSRGVLVTEAGRRAIESGEARTNYGGNHPKGEK